MGLFGWLFGNARSSGKRRPPNAPASGRCNQNIVGESLFQQHLGKIAGGKTIEGVEIERPALIVREPDNPHDSHAVRVEIDGLQVGFLPAKTAAVYGPLMDEQGTPAMATRALIIGGWKDGKDEGHFGVRLDLARKPR